MKNILIVGGSKGIGEALIKTLIKQNNVFNFSRSIPELAHKNLKHHTFDVLNQTDTLPEIDQIDSLIYCPGSINLKPFSRLTLDDFRQDFELNVVGAVRIIQHYLKALKKGNSPSILLFSTVATHLGMPYHASVAASKSSIEGLVKSLGAEFAPTIRVNAIAPTVTNTTLASKLLRNEKMIEAIAERHPLKAFLNPDEVAEMAQFLISEKARSISGQIFKMDCGIVSFKL